MKSQFAMTFTRLQFVTLKTKAMNEIEEIKSRIHIIRGRQVMLDKDLAELYGVEVKNLNKAVNRNIERFPEDFMFRLTKEEHDFLRFQNGTIKSGRG